MKRLSSKAQVRVSLVLVGILVAGIGIYLQFSSHAATSVAAVEAEAGTLAGGASKVANASASGGSAVKFSQPTFAFKHPGILVSKPQLDFVKGQLANSAQPWTGDLNKIYSRFKNTAFTPRAVATMDCSANTTNCPNMIDDSIGAYLFALQYYYSSASNKDAYAQASIRILNDWSSTLTAANGNEAKLEMSWSAENFTRAAEIIRYTYTPPAGETALDITGFSSMMKNVFLPQFDQTAPAVTSSNGNWHLSMIDATMNIGIFTNDKTTFDSAVSQWRQRVPAYIYLTSDGSLPAQPPGGLYNTTAKLNCFWLDASNSPTSSCSIPSGAQYVNGMVQETCRDAGHVALGMSSMIYAAETARLQGIDLYGEQQTRIVAGMELNAGFQNTYLTTGSYPNSPCGGTPQNGDGGAGWQYYWEVAYNHYHNRKGVSMPNTLTMINRVRPTGGANQDVFETLTHAESGSVALP